MFKCSRCKTRMINKGSADYETYHHDGEGVVIVYFCPKCEAYHIFYINRELCVEQIIVAFDDTDRGIRLTGEEMKICFS